MNTVMFSGFYTIMTIIYNGSYIIIDKLCCGKPQTVYQKRWNTIHQAAHSHEITE